jgi:hypothetical protein
MDVASSANTDSGAAGDGSSASEGGSLSVGVAVAIKLANVTNEAFIAGTMARSSVVPYFLFAAVFVVANVQ